MSLWRDIGALFTPTEKTKLAGIDEGAKDDQTGAEIKTAYEAESNAFTDTKDTKLNGLSIAYYADLVEEVCTNSAWTKVKELDMKLAGKAKITVDAKHVGADFSWMRFKKNGVQIYETSISNTTYQSYKHSDVTIAVDDTIELWTSKNGTSIDVRDFEVFAS